MLRLKICISLSLFVETEEELFKAIATGSVTISIDIGCTEAFDLRIRCTVRYATTKYLGLALYHLMAERDLRR